MLIFRIKIAQNLMTRVKKLIFIRYDENSKANNFYDHFTKKIHVSCDVQVNEENV
jgi:hypothetical protein